MTNERQRPAGSCNILWRAVGATELSFAPCLPSHWPQAELVLKRDGRTMRFVFARASVLAKVLAAAPADSQRLAVGQRLRWIDAAALTSVVIELAD